MQKDTQKDTQKTRKRHAKIDKVKYKSTEVVTDKTDFKMKCSPLYTCFLNISSNQIRPIRIEIDFMCVTKYSNKVMSKYSNIYNFFLSV